MNDVDTAGEITLESILAEYKSEAYIDGDKRTPSGILSEKADRIVMELSESKLSQAELTSTPPVSGDREADARPPTREDGAPAQSGTAPPTAQTTATAVGGGGGHGEREPEQEDGAPAQDSTATPAAGVPELYDIDALFFEQYQFADSDPPQGRNTAADSGGAGARERTKRAERRASGSLFAQGRADGGVDAESLPDDDAEIELDPREPDLRVAARKFALGDGDLLLRWTSSCLTACVMAALTFVFEAGAHLPFGLEKNQLALTGVLMILQLLVMIIGIEVLIRGVSSILRTSPGAEFLALMSNAATLCAGAVTLIRGDVPVGLPYSVISSFSIAFTLLGEKLYRHSYAETIKAAISVQEPYVGLTEYRDDLRRVVFRRARGNADGFYNALTSRDVCESAFRYAAPMLVAFAFVLTILSAFMHGQSRYLAHALSASLAAASVFSGHLAFSAPFSIISKRVRKAGAAMAGWMCAGDVADIDGLCVTDDDLFPEGTVSISGVKICEGVPSEKVIRYTAGLITASGSGLSRVFDEMLKREGMAALPVDNFVCYDGGISAIVHGERVLTGTAAYMKLMGVRVPEEMNLGNAVFTAIEDGLAAMFAMDYVPVNSVQGALMSIARWRIRLLFAVQDFNITTKMAEQKFKIPFEDVENLPIRNTYDIARGARGGRIAAVFTRDGLDAVGDLVSGARVLRTTALFATIISVAAAALGVLITASLCWIGAYHAVRAGNLLLFMLSTFAAALLVGGFAKFKR
jgi:hypothetical protein